MRTVAHEPTEFLTVDQAAQLAGRSHWAVRRWISSGLITRYKSAHRLAVSRSEILDLVTPKLVKPGTK